MENEYSVRGVSFACIAGRCRARCFEASKDSGKMWFHQVKPSAYGFPASFSSTTPCSGSKARSCDMLERPPYEGCTEAPWQRWGSADQGRGDPFQLLFRRRAGNRDRGHLSGRCAEELRSPESNVPLGRFIRRSDRLRCSGNQIQ